MTSSQEVHREIQSHFKNHFHKEDITEIEKHVGKPKSLSRITTTEETAKALTKMTNEKSPGKDNIPVELITNAPNISHQQISTTMINTFSEY